VRREALAPGHRVGFVFSDEVRQGRAVEHVEAQRRAAGDRSRKDAPEGALETNHG